MEDELADKAGTNNLKILKQTRKWNFNLNIMYRLEAIICNVAL